MRHVIIGAGVAGVTAAETIKQLDESAEVILVGKEGFLPYKRYLLTDFLCDSISLEEIFSETPQDLVEKGIVFRKGQYVKFIDPGKKTVKLFHNEVLSYDKLLIATGGCPALGPVLRPYTAFIQPYYSLEDIMVLKDKLPRIETCIVYGEGLSTLDLICGLWKLKKKITYIVPGTKAEFPLVEPEFADGIHDFLVQKGIDIVTGDRVIAIAEKAQAFTVSTLNRKELIADAVFAWDFYKPDIMVIAGTQIEKKLGILVNQFLETSEQDIYAAGDCVEIYHPGLKDYWINFGWPNAQDQGKIAARNMSGLKEQYQIHDAIVFNLMGKSLKARWWE